MFIERLYTYVMGAIIWWAGPNCGPVSTDSVIFLMALSAVAFISIKINFFKNYFQECYQSVK